MYAQRWERFLEYVLRARAKPTFDVEERERRLQLAEGLERVLAAARQGGPWLEIFDSVTGPLLNRFHVDLIYPLIPLGEANQFKAWGASGDAELPRSLSGFLDSTQTPVERFESFARAADEARQRGELYLHPSTVLALGSLFNFASTPETLPILSAELLEQLEKTLGYGFAADTTLVQQYEHHLAFIKLVQQRMDEADVPVRDMIDVQSLVFIASDQEDFWISGDPRQFALPTTSKPKSPSSDGVKPGEKTYLSVCASYRDEAPYLAEWIEFHRLVGVEKFYLYNNGSVDSHREVLAPYLEDGSVTLYDWHVFPGQVQAYTDCLRCHRFDSRWIAFLDLDTFLFSPTGSPVSELLVEYEPWPAVAVNLALYYSSGHREKPAGLVIENYLRRVNVNANKQIKSIVDPRRTLRANTPHAFAYPHLSPVDENHYPLSPQPAAAPHTKSVSFSRLRLNHYYTKSEAEFIEKWEWVGALYPAGPPGYGGSRAVNTPDAEKFEHIRTVEERFGEVDDAILKYVPALRDALAATAARRASPITSPSA
jgi:hypothetical protein